MIHVPRLFTLVPIKITRVLQGLRNAALALFHQHLGESLFKALVLRKITEARTSSMVGSHSTYEIILARKCPSLHGLQLQVCLLDQLFNFHSVTQLHSSLSTPRLKDIALSCSHIPKVLQSAIWSQVLTVLLRISWMRDQSNQSKRHFKPLYLIILLRQYDPSRPCRHQGKFLIEHIQFWNYKPFLVLNLHMEASMEPRISHC